MYEKIRSELLTRLSDRFSSEDLKIIGEQLDETMRDCTVTAAERTLMIPGREELKKLIKTYVVVRGIEGLSAKTLKNYAMHLLNFAEWVKCPIKELTANDIRLYLYEYQQTRGITNRSLDAIRSCLAPFFGWAANEGHIAVNPMQTIKPIKHERKPRQALTQIELEYIRNACKTQRERAIIEMLYSTGCRVSELCGIRLNDINWHTGEVHLLGKGSKHRTSYINAKAEVAVKEYLRTRKHDSIYLFCNEVGGGQMHKDSVEKMMRGISGRCKNMEQKITPHILRHTTATQALKSGMPVQDIQQLLGHESIATTMIYAKTSLEAVAAGHKRCVI